jgi:hypothetical protein
MLQINHIDLLSKKKYIFFSDLLLTQINLKPFIHTYMYWILSWAVTLELSARKRSDKPVKNLSIKTENFDYFTCQ